MSATARALVNRENAQASTGPKSETGKAVSRMNALEPVKQNGFVPHVDECNRLMSRARQQAEF
jgi:hypothetical protein